MLGLKNYSINYMHDVSIIIPAYIRTEQELGWLKECVDSAHKQDCEIVVYSDGSPIDPYELLVSLKYDIIYEHGERRHGAAYARNQAADLATKELILPLDCDDRLVDGAVDRLLSVWDGEVPVYPDISKFGDVHDEHYFLLDFNCDWVYTYVGFSSVNVLHKRDYWRTLGGWDEGLEFYEDGEYNARLFSQWCGKRLPEPLVEYRQHPAQRTNIYKKQANAYARLILAKSRRLSMACKGCGSKRSKVTAANNPGTIARAANVEEAIIMASSLPGELDGKVLAVYTGGKGMGKHYYQGPSSKYPYKVQHGDTIYVSVEDTQEYTGASLFQRVKGVEVESAPTPSQAQAPKEKPKEVEKSRVARALDTARTPVIEKHETVDLPDIYNLTTKQIMALDLDYETARQLLIAEKRGKNRVKVSKYLEGLVKA
jgi:hypothetical protein